MQLAKLQSKSTKAQVFDTTYGSFNLVDHILVAICQMSRCHRVFVSHCQVSK